MIKLLTCQTWVTKWDWFDYAQKHQKQVSPNFLLVDRSPCMEPFLDPYAPSENEKRRPIISGLCRGFNQSLRENDIYIYITRVERRKKLYEALDIPWQERNRHYLGGAALKIVKIHASHAKAAESFTSIVASRRYVVAPNPTPYPPNLAHDLDDLWKCVAVRPKSCIIWRDDTPLTPDHFDEDMWRDHVKEYYDDQVKRQLRAAECCVHQVEDGRDILQLNPKQAPVLTPADWGEDQGEKKMIRGVLKDLKQKWADRLYQKIANGR